MIKAGKNIQKLRRKLAGQIKYFVFFRFAVPPNLFSRLLTFAAPFFFAFQILFFVHIQISQFICEVWIPRRANPPPPPAKKYKK